MNIQQIKSFKDYWFKQYVKECDKYTKNFLKDDIKNPEKYFKYRPRKAHNAQNKFLFYQKIALLIEIKTKKP